MRIYSENITPDSLTGCLMALEGIDNVCTILNGPTGCKFYHSAISNSQYVRESSFVDKNYKEIFYFGQPRIPATYLDTYDYIYGSTYKLKDILRIVSKKNYDFISIVNSPGAALIGDDLDRFLEEEISDKLYISIENTGYSGKFSDGFQKTYIDIISKLAKNNIKKTDRVNIVGINNYQKYFEGNKILIENYLKRLGLSNIKYIGINTNIKDLENIAESRLNIALYPEYSLDIVKFLKKEYNIDYLICDDFFPLGFDKTDKFLKSILQSLNLDNSRLVDLLEDKEKYRAISYMHISKFSSLTGLPKGSLFSIKSSISEAYGLLIWLTKYLGMSPVAIELEGDVDNKSYIKLKNYLSSINCENVLNKKVLETSTDLLFSDGNTISQMKLRGEKFAGIEINLPTLGYIDVIPKSILMYEGALYLIEQILNGLQFTVNC